MRIIFCGCVCPPCSQQWNEKLVHERNLRLMNYPAIVTVLLLWVFLIFHKAARFLNVSYAVELRKSLNSTSMHYHESVENNALNEAKDLNQL